MLSKITQKSFQLDRLNGTEIFINSKKQMLIYLEMILICAKNLHLLDSLQSCNRALIASATNGYVL